MFGNPTEIALLVAAAAILFGAERIPKLARGLGQAKKEFQLGQAEADAETERLKAEAQAKVEAAVQTPVATSTVAQPAAAQPAPAAQPVVQSTGGTTPAPGTPS